MKKTKQVLAIICVIILVGLYVAAFITSLFDKSASMVLFKGCIALTIFIPVVAYIYICLHKYAMTRSGRKDFYSPGSSGDDNGSSGDVSE